MQKIDVKPDFNTEWLYDTTDTVSNNECYLEVYVRWSITICGSLGSLLTRRPSSTFSLGYATATPVILDGNINSSNTRCDLIFARMLVERRCESP